MEISDFAMNLRKIIADLDNLVTQLENCASENVLSTSISVRVKDLRCIGILEEIFRKGSKISVKELPALCQKYGRTFRSISGYMGGKRPSIQVSNTDPNFRELTKYAEATIKKYRTQWGENWLSYIDMDTVGNPNTPDNLILYLKEDE